mmetsp:Transcript_23934/g.63330  ORF Transcript_23934/g.63330 Transcript_23934/m.63330 type:complete len:105 (+) Transcript_23934:395-709(+)
MCIRMEAVGECVRLEGNVGMLANVDVTRMILNMFCQTALSNVLALSRNVGTHVRIFALSHADLVRDVSQRSCLAVIPRKVSAVCLMCDVPKLSERLNFQNAVTT